MSARPWTPESRDALLTRVTAITTGTAVAGCVGALGLAVGLAATTHVTPTTKAAGATKPAPAAPASSKAPAAPSEVAPGDVHVEVLNGIGIAGAAGAVAEQLRAAGFDVVAVGNANGAARASGIIYPPGRAAEFRTLSKATGVTLSSAQGTGSALILVLGPDWPGSLPAAPSGQGSGGFAQPPAVPQAGSSNGGGSATSGGS